MQNPERLTHIPSNLEFSLGYKDLRQALLRIGIKAPAVQLQITSDKLLIQIENEYLACRHELPLISCSSVADGQSLTLATRLDTLISLCLPDWTESQSNFVFSMSGGLAENSGTALLTIALGNHEVAQKASVFDLFERLPTPVPTTSIDSRCLATSLTRMQPFVDPKLGVIALCDGRLTAMGANCYGKVENSALGSNELLLDPASADLLAKVLKNWDSEPANIAADGPYVYFSSGATICRARCGNRECRADLKWFDEAAEYPGVRISGLDFHISVGRISAQVAKDGAVELKADPNNGFLQFTLNCGDGMARATMETQKGAGRSDDRTHTARLSISDLTTVASACGASSPIDIQFGDKLVAFYQRIDEFSISVLRATRKDAAM